MLFNLGEGARALGLVIALALLSSQAKAIDIIGRDDRVGSDDPFTARVSGRSFNQNGYCTATLLANNCMISASHCQEYMDQVEFNVPRSYKGEAVPARLNDRYEIEKDSIIDGDPIDWIVFKIKRNSRTRKTAEQAQGGFIHANFREPVVNEDVAIFGYGVSQMRSLNLSQKIGEGQVKKPKDALGSGFPIRHSVDTMTGDSGAGIRVLGEREIIGLHIGSNYDDKYNVGIFFWSAPGLSKAINDCTGMSYEHPRFPL